MLPMLSCIFSKGHSKMISWPMVMWGVKGLLSGGKPSADIDLSMLPAR